MKIQLKVAYVALAVTAIFWGTEVVFSQDSERSKVTRPAGYKPLQGDPRSGQRLFSDTKLSSNGMSCASCHANNESFSETFSKPYPHRVVMADEELSIASIHLDEMIQACMIMPMASQPLPWGSQKLADLTAYLTELQKTFKPAP